MCPRAQERKAAAVASRKTSRSSSRKTKSQGKGGPVGRKIKGKGVPKGGQRLPSRERPRPDAPWDACPQGAARRGQGAAFAPSGEVPGTVIGTFRKDKSDAKAKAKTMLSATAKAKAKGKAMLSATIGQ